MAGRPDEPTRRETAVPADDAVDRERRRRWAAEISARAVAFWTATRRRKLFGDLQLVLPPWEAAPLLRALGLLNGDGSMPPASVRKYMQIGHMVLLLEPLLRRLAAERPVVRVLDAGCGSSYLTLLLAWCFRHRWHHPAELLGVDRDPVVVRRCRKRAALVDLDDVLRCEVAPLETLDVPAAWGRAFGAPPPPDRPLDVLVALHACDIATDDALALGVRLGAELIAAAPCCQAELAQAWAALAETGVSGAFAPVWRSNHLRREAGATLTDALRTLLLRGCGYEVTPMEFVGSSHTPKNTLLRAVRVGIPDPEAFAEYAALRRAVGGPELRLARILPEPHRSALQAIDP
ncbi:MAG: methyltransferase [Deltaproteobacteria bacterium]|nr:methyltransferase [Deltaproteobacteria bacterium]